MDPKLTGNRSVTERDISGTLRGAREVSLEALSGAGTTVNGLSSLSSVEFHYSFVRVRHVHVTKGA